MIVGDRLRTPFFVVAIAAGVLVLLVELGSGAVTGGGVAGGALEALQDVERLGDVQPTDGAISEPPGRGVRHPELTIATMEIGVALVAFDADKVEGRLGIRPSAPGEKFEGLVGTLSTGTLVIADEKRPVAVLFGDTAEGRGVHPETKRTLLAAVGVKGVPDVALEEALWLAASAMRA